MKGWQPDGTGIMSSGGYCGGDIQRGDSYSVRFCRPDLPSAMITCTAYAAEDDRNPGEFFIQVQTEWLLCTDPADPGGTETWSDITCDDDDARIFDTAGEAEQAARQRAVEELAGAESLEWDGEPW